MEPEIMLYLNRIMNSIGIFFLWLTLNSTLGIMWGYAFIEKHWQLGNILFYIFLLTSLAGLLLVLYKIWIKPVGFKIH